MLNLWAAQLDINVFELTCQICSSWFFSKAVLTVRFFQHLHMLMGKTLQKNVEIILKKSWKYFVYHLGKELCISLQEGSTQNIYLDYCGFFIRSTFSWDDKSIIVCYVLGIKSLDCIITTLKRTCIMLGLLRQRGLRLWLMWLLIKRSRKTDCHSQWLSSTYILHHFKRKENVKEIRKELKEPGEFRKISDTALIFFFL